MVIGGSECPTMVNEKGIRASSHRAYLEPAMERSNLHVITDAYVLKVYLCAKCKFSNVFRICPTISDNIIKVVLNEGAV